MDEFGVLTERYGLKPQGKSAPMSAPRVDPLPAASSSSAAAKSYLNSASSSYGIFGGNGGVSNANTSFDDFDSILSSSKSSSADAGGNASYDIFGSFPSNSNRASFPKSPVGDLLGDFESPNPNPPSQTTNHSFNGLDDFAFAHKPSPSSRNSNASEDPFVVFKSSANASSATFDDPLFGFDVKTTKLRPPPKPGNIIKADKGSFIDEFQDFTSAKETRRSPKATKYKEAEEPSQKLTQDSSFDLLSSLNSPRSMSAPKSRVATQDPFFDLDSTTDSSSSNDFFSHNGSSSKNGVDELYSILGGESDERRKARLGRIRRTQDRMDKAVADMNTRDSKIQQEQEERRRIAEQMDVVIKRWANGKEGNLRSLLSSLHQVLWPESGWEAVSRSDVVSSSDVKKLFRKASLCVHPDKVQQKGASLHERYIAEKVFDILKEAWNKFNRDER